MRLSCDVCPVLLMGIMNLSSLTPPENHTPQVRPLSDGACQTPSPLYVA